VTRATMGAANRAEVGKAVVHRVTFIELNFPSGVLRSNTGDRTYTFAGFDWFADGLLLNVSGLSEVIDNKARSCTLELSGAHAGLMTKVMNDKFAWSEASVYEGFCDEAWTLVADPHAAAPYMLMSAPKIKVSKTQSVVEITLEKWTIRSSRPAPVLGTPHSQRLRYANDTGFDRVAHILTQSLEWGGEYGRGGGTPLNGRLMEYHKND
jgi:hypothetical protein